MKLRTALTVTTEQLTSVYPTPEMARMHALWLLEKVTQLSLTALITALDDAQLTTTQQQELDTFIFQLVHEKKPLQYIIGSLPFGNLSFLIEPPILIPRPETEEWCMHLIDQLNAHTEPLVIIDLCTGSGCIALTLAHAFPRSTVYAVDIQPHAIALVTKNMQRNNITNCIPILSDLYTKLPAIQADLIVANPPYVSKAEWENLDPCVQKWEDSCALIAEDTGYALIKKIVQDAPAFLKKQQTSIPPQLWIEIGATQAPTVTSYFTENNFSSVTLFRDMYGRDRVITGVYT